MHIHTLTFTHIIPHPLSLPLINMYKSKLQNLCQLRQWPLPKYTPLKTGPDHNPTFTATVTVNGVTFSTTEFSYNSKEAQDNAARTAFKHFTGKNPPPPVIVHVAPDVGSAPIIHLHSDPHAGLCIGGPSTPMNGSPSEVTSKKFIVTDSHAGLCIGGPSTLVNGSPSEVTSKKFIDSAHLYKNRLQNYALKRSLTLPVYSCEREGPPHAPRFRCTVTFQGKTSEISEFYPTLKEAEHAAAKKAWESWSLDEVQQDDTALYKNLLQQYLQRAGCPLPKYETTISGPPHMPVFVSKVNIQGHVYEGQAASSKKHAESHAAKVAYAGLQDQERAEERKFFSGQHTERQPVFSSGYRIKEALEESSSILQSVIAKAGDLPSKLTPNANHLVPAERSEEYAANTDEVPPSSPETDNNAKRLCLPSSDLFDFDPSAFSSINTNNVYQQVGSTDLQVTTNETIVVRPRIPNMTCPAGASLLPFSDDKWVAMKMKTNR